MPAVKITLTKQEYDAEKVKAAKLGLNLPNYFRVGRGLPPMKWGGAREAKARQQRETDSPSRARKGRDD
jgi:hypothetical protein